MTKVKSGKINRQPNIIEALNFKYVGPVDGHDLPGLIKELTVLKKIKGPKLLHVITTKGKGLRQAEEHQVKYHAPGKFDAVTGDLLPRKGVQQPPKYSEVLGQTLNELYAKNEKLVTITPAMPTGSGLNELMQKYPKRTFDVGIAEQHAVTLAAGMATEGLVPFCVVYSTFLQRAYDQIIHDVALQNLPVVFCVDRAGLVGQDGATHHGVFDIAYLRCIPNLMIAAPENELEFRNLIYTASLGLEKPLAIRYPRGRGELLDWQKEFTFVEMKQGKAKNISSGSIALLTTGKMTAVTNKVIVNNSLEAKLSHYHFPFVKPLDENLLHIIFSKYEHLITIEDGVVSGGFGSAVLEKAKDENFKGNIQNIGVPDRFIDHGTTEELYELCGMDEKGILEVIGSLI